MRTARTLEAEWRQVLRGSVGTGTKEDEWTRLCCWISPCYGPFSLGPRLETYEPFVSLIFKIVSGRGKPRITETVDTESVNMGARLY
jgi:hypothetical protein